MVSAPDTSRWSAVAPAISSGPPFGLGARYRQSVYLCWRWHFSPVSTEHRGWRATWEGTGTEKDEFAYVSQTRRREAHWSSSSAEFAINYHARRGDGPVIVYNCRFSLVVMPPMEGSDPPSVDARFGCPERPKRHYTERNSMVAAAENEITDTYAILKRSKTGCGQAVLFTSRR